jgi:predicted ArsR family transcriptional regulator
MSKRQSTSKSRTHKPAASTKRSRSKPSTSRADSKQARLIEMLKRAGGATIDEVVKALGWQPHTVRGAMAGALKKKLGLKIESEKIEERGRVYRIAG